MQPTYGKQPAAAKLGVSVTALNRHHMPHLLDWGIATEVAPRMWAFAQPNFGHYCKYVASVRQRKEAGTLPGNYAYSEWDMECCTSGEWDDDNTPA